VVKKAFSYEALILIRMDREELSFPTTGIHHDHRVHNQCDLGTRVGRYPIPSIFVSEALQDPETRYQMVKKLALSLVNAARGLRSYFQNH